MAWSFLSILTHSVLLQGDKKWTGFTHLTSWENDVYESEWTLTQCELETTQVIQICLSESAWLSSSFTSNPLLALLHTFREHFLGFINCWEIPHFNTQTCGFASFVLAKSWDVADKLLPVLIFLFKEFSTAAAQAHLPFWAKGQSGRQCCLVDGTSLRGGVSTGKRNYCHLCLARMSTQSHVGEEQEKCSMRVKREMRTWFYIPHGIAMLTFKQWNENFT